MRFVFSFVLWALSFGLSFASDFQVSASLDRQRLALNEQAVLSVTVSGSGNSLPNPKLPELPNFQVYNAGRAQNFSWINGKASASVTSNFVLTPLSEGVFKIPPIEVEGAQTPELSLEVVKAGSSVPGPSREAAPGGTPQSSSGASQKAPAIFISAIVDRANVYVGEPIIFSFRLHNRVNLLRQPAYQPPETSGFWTEDLPPQRNYQSTVKGVPYNVTEVRTALFPTSPGKARIGAAQLQVALENVSSDPFSNDFFASFFGRAEEKILRTEPIAINVKPLPEPKPAGFAGAVGQYSISASMDKTEIAVGNTVTLTTTISGRGHIKSLPDITLPKLPNFRTLGDNAAVNIEKQDGEVRGSKVFKTVLIPGASGDFTIPAITFVYFDTATHTYKTISTKPFSLKVLPGPAGSSNPTQANFSTDSPSGSAPGIQRLTEDIHYIRTSPIQGSQARPLYQQSWYRWLHGLILLTLGGFALFLLYKRLFLSDRRAILFKNAKAVATPRFQKAATAHELAQALQHYLADKLSPHQREMSLRQAQELLRERGLSAHSTEKLRVLWETLDLLRFAPSQAKADDISQARAAALQLVENFEKEIQWKN